MASSVRNPWPNTGQPALTEVKHLKDRLPVTQPGRSLCWVPKRKSVVVVNQREDLMGRFNAAHGVVAK